MADSKFELGDKLPTYYEAAIAIFKVTQIPNRPKMKSVLTSYYSSLVELWVKSFGADHVMTNKSVMAKLEKLVNSYFNKVYKRAHMKKEDGRLGAGMSMRQLNKVK